MEFSSSRIFAFSCTKCNRIIIIAEHFDGSQVLIFSILFSRKLKTSWGWGEMMVLKQSENLSLPSTSQSRLLELDALHAKELLNWPCWRY